MSKHPLDSGDRDGADNLPHDSIGDPFIDEHGRPNKSALKRQAQGLQELGEELIALPQSEFDAMTMPENLRDAVALARRITAHGGLYRQKQYIGKLMRKIDSEPIRAAIAARQERDRTTMLRFQAVERWRNRLLDDATALSEFTRQFPAADASLLTRLAAQAKHERERQQPPKAARELFGVVRTVVLGDE